MTKISWDDTGKLLYGTGIDRGVIYPPDSPGVAWNGLISAKETPSGAEESTSYMDGMKYRISKSKESFVVAVTAFLYPDEFMEFDGVQDYVTRQPRKTFGFSYRSLIGNDLESTNYGYQIHLVYNNVAIPSSRLYDSVNAGVEPMNFQWNFFTKPEIVAGAKPSAHLVIDSTVAYPSTIKDLEDILYGTDITPPRFPSVDEVLEVFESHAILRITDHGDGTWTADGPASAIKMLTSTKFEITWPSAIYIDSRSYTISSL